MSADETARDLVAWATGSRSGTVAAGQAAYEAMALHSLSDDGPPGRSAGWDALEPWQHGRWEAAARAAIAAAAPAPAGEAASHVVSHTPAVVRPVLGSVIVLALQDGTPETSARELADTLAALNQGIAVLTVRGVDALRTWEPEQPQAAPGADAAAPTCPCCSAIIRAPAFEDGPFCWSCGLYRSDNPAACDNEDHYPGPTITETAP